MRDATDLLSALRDVGVAVPTAGDRGDERVRRAVEHEIKGRRRSGRRLRLPFSGRSIALMPAALLTIAVTAAAAAAGAGTVALFASSPTRLFEQSPTAPSRPGLPHETVVASTVHVIDTFRVPGVGPVQYWVADTAQHGLCQALRRPDGTWAGYADHGTGGGQMPGCGPTRAQVVAAQDNSHVGLAPMSVDEQSVSIRDPAGRWWDIYFGIVAADGAAGVKDIATGHIAPLIDERYFVMVVRRHGNCMGCDNLRAIDAAGKLLPADYGPAQDRNH
jgi:hypothetical protein